MEFRDWIYKKFIEWRGDSRGTVSGFAKYVGVSQPVMSNWMNPKGNIPRSQKAITCLVNRYGNEVYEVLGLPIPVSESPFDSFPLQIREIFEKSRDEINAIYARENVPADSPEALRIAERVFSKYGITINSAVVLDDE